MRSAVIFLSVVVGESVSRFDIVMALIGGSLTGSLVFVLPPLIYTQILALKRNLSHVAITKERIYSGSCKRLKRFNDEEQRLMDPGAHSHSIYYGFLSTTNNPRRYRMFNYLRSMVKILVKMSRLKIKFIYNSILKNNQTFRLYLHSFPQQLII